MHLLDGRPVYSAGDLVGFLACEHLTDLERAALAGLTRRPTRDDPELDLIRKRGFEHERRYRDNLQAAGRAVTEILPDAYPDAPDGSREAHGDNLRRQARETIEAMRRGDDVIYQAAFFDDKWRGHADFLLRCDGSTAGSDLGPYHYEIADTKLAHKTKASALIQLCTYVDLLTPLQGRVPNEVHVALGGSARLVESHRVADYLAYYRALKARFEATVATDGTGAPPAAYPPLSYPDPVEHCDVCRWTEICRGRWRADDHLSLVAGITRNQRRGLSGRSVATRRSLATLALPVSPPLEHASREAVARVREQARIQVEGEDAGTVLYELLEPERLEDGTVVPARGLAALPQPSLGDLFFDIEGDPFAFDDGLEYLFGVIEPNPPDARTTALLATDTQPGDQPTLWDSHPTGQPAFHFSWGLDPAQEKRAFEWFVDFVMERRQRDPNLHVYHFGTYERGRVARLSTRHATREEEVDVLLRAGTFVDLFNVVRQGLRASVESYSIKRLEPLYGYRRSVDLQLAGDSIVEFERYLEDGGRDDSILETIREYNRDDCVSTLRLRDWLEERRAEAEAQFGLSLPRPSPTDGAPSEQQSAARAEVQAVADRLTAGIPPDEEVQTPADKARRLLANLLDWHWREEKSTWWRFYDLMSRPDDELELAREPIAGLVFESETPPSGRRRNPIRRYSFPPQENELDVDKNVHDPRLLGVTPLGGIGRVVDINQIEGWVEISTSLPPGSAHPTALVPLDKFGTDTHRRALLNLGEWVADNGPSGPRPHRAARDLLMRVDPRAGQAAGEELAGPGESGADAALRLVHRLDETTLPIQGPPGSGKSTTGAQMILSLLAAGRRVGITANSHKVISGLLEKVLTEADKGGQAVRAVQRINRDGQGLDSPHVRLSGDTGGVRRMLDAGEAQVAAGTSWLWTHAEMAQAVDVLLVDEAGQMSLANALAVAQGARNLVLLGDPQQLEQPIQGSHPTGAGASALEHLLDGRQTIEGHRGLFLEHTWRLHPDVCRFTSELFYEDRLEAREHLSRQALHWPAPLGGTGLRWVPVEHEGNHSRSDEEADEIVQLARSLVEQGAEWTDGDGRRGPLRWSDVLIVAPYNAQVRAIRDRLPAEARDRVGTVDKFQGQQGAVVLYSMTTSSPEEAPHGMEFLYSLNRLNVATSRARCLAVLFASPKLLRVRCRAPHQMRLANALCRFIELADVVPATSRT